MTRRPSSDPADPRRPAHVEWAPVRVEGRAGRRLMLILRAPGCAWALGPEGGCTNCGFLQLTTHGRPVASEDLLAQVRSVVDPLLERGVPGDLLEVDLYNSGSFFNEDEVPADARTPILELLGRMTPLRLVLIESRPEYISESAVRAAREALDRHRSEFCRLQVGIGLEAVSSQVRNGLIRKGFDLRDYEQAAAAIGRAGVELLAYVLQKPRGLEEEPAIEEAVRTIEYVFATALSAGVRVRASLEPVLVLADTVLAEIYREGRYQPPNLWSVIEVIRRTSHLGDLRVGVSDEGMHTLAAPRGCDRCTGPLREALREFDATGDPAGLDRLDCSCRQTQ